MKTLHLTLKKKWFDMILSGEKKEEYRELKMYWATRLTTGFPSEFGINKINPDFQHFDTIVFKNGYSKQAPEMEVECKGIEIGITKSHWCDEGEIKVYVIKLGKILFFKNCSK